MANILPISSQSPVQAESALYVSEMPVVQHEETSQNSGSIRRFLGRCALATACIIPVADLALSDATFAKAYDVIATTVDVKEPVLEKSLELSLMGGVVFAESFLLGLAITRRKKLQNSFGVFDEYVGYKQEHMGKGRRALSAVLNSPLTAIGAIGKKVEKLGERIEKVDSKLVRGIGALAVEAGHINAVGTSTVILNETIQGKTPGPKRIAKLSALIAGSWIGAAEAVRYSYRGLKSVDYIGAPTRGAMAGFGRGYELLTNVDLQHIQNTPVGVAFLGFIGACLGRVGWNVAKFYEQNPMQIQTEAEEVSRAA